MHQRTLVALHRAWPNLILYGTPTCAMTKNAYSDSTLSVVSSIPPHMLVHHAPTLYVHAPMLLEDLEIFSFRWVHMFLVWYKDPSYVITP